MNTKDHAQATIYHCHCNFCSYTSNNNYQTKRHARRHIETYKCNSCPKTYPIQDDLNRHINRHHNEDYKPKPIPPRPRHKNSFECDLCSNSYKSKRTLISHKIFVHKGLKIHKCKLCDKTYSDSTPLRQHMETVHTEKYFLRNLA